jgi:hypothetical protein
LRIDSAEDGVLAHDDFVGRERNKRASRHRVMRHEDGDLGFVVANGLRDLERRQNQPARGVKNHVERHLVVRHLDGAQDFLGVIDVDVARERESQEPHDLLPVHEEYHPGISLLLQLRDLARPHGLEHALTQDRLQGREHEEEPEDISDGHVMLLSSHRLGPSHGVETKEALISVVRSMLALRQDQQTSQKHAREETPDVRPPSDSGSGRRHEEFAHALRELHQEPDSDEDDRWSIEEEGKNMFWTGNILSRAPLT